MKIGIVTFHGALNFGSALPAFALTSVLERLGHDASIVDYRALDYEQYRLLQLNHPRSMLRIACRWNKYYSRLKAFETFLNRFLKLTNKAYSWRNENELNELSTQFNCFMCGSDQIWNLDCTSGVVEPFFLSFAGDKRRVAYAPSLAHTSFKPENFDKKKVAELLSKFDYLSVREEETLPLFQPLVDKKIDVVLDPTLLLKAEDYSKLASREVVESGYIFVYLLRECPELIESASGIAEASGKRVVYISEKNFKIPNSTNLFGVGPEEFVSLIAHSDLVLTNSFHATVFSVLFHKPFRVFATDRSGARMRDLLGNLGLSSRCTDAACTDEVLPANWNDVECRLDKLREHSWAYLRRALA